ncbi:MAG TPA: nucleotidyl transferase AbiEii/AbiGii toxin family protein [Myxococcota bacterium]|nr:nucleotidyl transferase AbiEii/AbiGii toxin family protein [Myxococcota bacterium]
MARTYATPGAFKAALEQRLRSRAAGDGLELQRLRQLLVFDRFMARVVMEFEQAVVLKGGLVLELRLQRARTTKDIDLRLRGDPDEALSRLQRAGRRSLGDYFAFTIVPDPRHSTIEAEGMSYEGLRFRAQCRLADKEYGRPFGVDIAIAEPLVATPDVIVGEPWLEFAGVGPVTMQVYPLEAHIAEKVHALTLPRSRPNSRVKDLPDIALLATIRPIDAESLRAAITATWEHRGTHPLPAMVPDAPQAWEPVYREMARASDLRWATLSQLMDAVSRFLDPVLAGAGGGWEPDEWAWMGTPGESNSEQRKATTRSAPQ